jgi:hypothetical protein
MINVYYMHLQQCHNEPPTNESVGKINSNHNLNNYSWLMFTYLISLLGLFDLQYLRIGIFWRKVFFSYEIIFSCNLQYFSKVHLETIETIY